jgi:hypothetical protein
MKTFLAKINVDDLDDLQWDHYCRGQQHPQVTFHGCQSEDLDEWSIQASTIEAAAHIVMGLLRGHHGAFVASLEQLP